MYVTSLHSTGSIPSSPLVVITPFFVLFCLYLFRTNTRVQIQTFSFACIVRCMLWLHASVVHDSNYSLTHTRTSNIRCLLHTFFTSLALSTGSQPVASVVCAHLLYSVLDTLWLSCAAGLLVNVFP